MKHSIPIFIVCLVGLTAGSISGWAQAQTPIRHELIRSDMPPGMAAAYYQMSHRSLVGAVQPVQLVTPPGTMIDVGGARGFSAVNDSRVSVGMMLGSVYRFRLSQLPLPASEGRELYPSIEVLNRMNPPAGMEYQFPIQVVITRSDLEHALAGRLVTRVIYLEDPRGVLPHKHRADDQPSFDVGGGEDPLRAAEKLGRPMAILRMGSRVPLDSDPVDHFNFGAPLPQVLPDPSADPQLGMDPSPEAGSMSPAPRRLPISADSQTPASPSMGGVVTASATVPVAGQPEGARLPPIVTRPDVSGVPR